MEFYNAWNYLINHKIFNNRFNCDGLYMDVVKVNPITNTIDADKSKNTKVQIWLESGPYENYYGCTHDIRLDCGGDTFEEAIIQLASLVKQYYD